MSIAKDYRYRVGVEWEGGRRTHVSSPGKLELEVATPPEFKGGLAGVWSPEDLLVASVATCYAVTLVAVLERRDLPLRELHVSGTGHLTTRDDSRFGFVAIELTVTLATDERSVDAVLRAAKHAERACLVSTALDIPVHVGLIVKPSESRLEVVA
ncbi:MAG TPA: OsmC family protein [Gaiellaceae bacterium]|nr:OsmC family protein [Gaiellaceae bacterium]